MARAARRGHGSRSGVMRTYVPAPPPFVSSPPRIRRRARGPQRHPAAASGGDLGRDAPRAPAAGGASTPAAAAPSCSGPTRVSRSPARPSRPCPAARRPGGRCPPPPATAGRGRPGTTNSSASGVALNISRNESSVMRSPRGPGSEIALPLRNTASARRLRRVPVPLGHLLALGSEPGDVRQLVVGALHRPPVEEAPTPEDRVVAAQPHHRAGEVQQFASQLLRCRATATQASSLSWQ